MTSAANPLIKSLKALHTKKGRAESGLFLAEGARLAAEAVQLGAWPRILLASPAAQERPAVRALLGEAAGRGVKVVETSEAILAQVSKRDNPQTVVGAWPQRLAPLQDLDARAARLVVALEGPRDPGNLGTVVRTADAVGAAAVVLLGQTCDPFSVETVRATMGSIFAVPLVRAEFSAFDAWRRTGGLALAGASLKGAPWPDAPGGRLAVLMGNEQSGLPEAMERACDVLVRLPMAGRADSLNLASATAVMLYEAWRRQGYADARP